MPPGALDACLGEASGIEPVSEVFRGHGVAGIGVGARSTLLSRAMEVK